MRALVDSAARSGQKPSVRMPRNLEQECRGYVRFDHSLRSREYGIPQLLPHAREQLFLGGLVGGVGTDFRNNSVSQIECQRIRAGESPMQRM